MDKFLDYMNSFFGVIIIIAGFVLIPEIRKKKIYWIAAIVIGLFMVYVGIDKIKRDNKKDADNLAAQSKIQTRLTTDSLDLDTTKRDMREMNAYLHRLDSIGIQRNPNTNMPIINKKVFTNYIGSVGTLNQN